MTASAPRDTVASPLQRVVLPLQLGDVWIAIDPSYVQEVLGTRTWMPVPGAPPSLPGVLTWRSRAIAVLDMRELIGIAQRAVATPPRTIVARVDDCTFAFFVDTVREARTVDETRLAPPHAVTGRFVKQQLTIDGQVMPIVELPAVIEAVARTPGERA